MPFLVAAAHHRLFPAFGILLARGIEWAPPVKEKRLEQLEGCPDCGSDVALMLQLVTLFLLLPRYEQFKWTLKTGLNI